MKKLPKKIAVLGVGLIGGSIAVGLKKHFGSKITILGLCNSFKRAKEAQKQGIVDKAIDGLNSIPSDIDLIIIATPINDTLDILQKLDQKALKNVIIMDVGSTKETVVNEVEKLAIISNSFVGTHPMAGSEMSGFENASVNIFRNKPWLICPSASTKKENIKAVMELISILGANPMIMDAVSHDMNSSWASHLSLVASSILVNLCTRQINWNSIAQIASTGFRDTTRLASDNPNMKTDIIQTNRQNLVKCLKELNDEITLFLELLDKNNRQNIFEYFKNAKTKRDNWIQNNFS